MHPCWTCGYQNMHFFSILICRTTQICVDHPTYQMGGPRDRDPRFFISCSTALPPPWPSHIQSTHPQSNVNSWTFQKCAPAYKLSTRNTRRKMAMMMLQAWICLRARLTESFPPQRPQQRQQQKHRPTNSTSGKETRNTAQDTRMDSSPIISWNRRPYLMFGWETDKKKWWKKDDINLWRICSERRD